jgi:hypothetical protein
MTKGNDPINFHLTYNSYSGNPDGCMEGLTKREYFAAMAMQGLVTSGKYEHWDSEQLGAVAVRISEGLIKALNEPPKTEV